MAVEALFESSDPSWIDKWDARVARLDLPGSQVLVVEPQTFMNLSGFAVVRAAGFYRIPPEDIAVIHDDIDLPLGRVIVKAGGGDGGHRGVRSVIEQLGTREFVRIRIGVGRPVGPGPEVVDYVLQRFSDAEEMDLSDAVKTASVAIREWVSGGVPKAQNRVNRRGNPKRSEPSCPPEGSDGPKDRKEV